MCLNYKLIIEFAKCDNFILQFILYFGENEKRKKCVLDNNKKVFLE